MLSCMPRTTIDIDATILRDVKRIAGEEHKSIGRVVSELLARALTAHAAQEHTPSLDWSSQEMTARVDLEDKDALHAALDDQ